METNQEYLSPEEVLFQKVVKQFEAKNWSQTIALCTQLQSQVPQLHPDKAIQFYDMLGKSLKSEQHYTEAWTAFNTLIREFPNSHLGLDGLIQLTQIQKNWEQMLKLSLIFQKFFPKMWQGYWYEGLVHQETQNWEKAHASFQYLTQHFPKHKFGLQGLIQIAQKQKNWQDVVALSAQFQQKFPKIWQGTWWKGHAHRHLKQFDEATAEFSKLQHDFPKLHHGSMGLINVAQAQKQWNQLLELTSQFQAAHPNMWQGWWWKGQAHRHLKQFDEAIHEFTQLQQQFPKQHHGLEGVINVAQSQQNWQAVVELSKHFQLVHPNMWQGAWWQIEAQNKLQLHEAVEAGLARFAQTFPEQYPRLLERINKSPN